jgi:GntR family transcriptional regulator / MocR family aminotransferase
MRIASLYRYPVKGLSPERLSTVQVATAEGFPLDRMYALLRTQADFDPDAPVWLAKANFVMLMMHEQIAGLKTHYLHQDKKLVVTTPTGRQLEFLLGESAGRAELEQFFADFMPKHLTTAPRLLGSAGHQFTDKAAKYVSLINLATLRELEQCWGETLDPLRFRANVYIDDVEPFSELDWIGREIQLGSVVAKVAQRNGRCAATNVNPETGVRDRNVPGKLRAAFGHKDLGVYLSITQGGQLNVEDPVQIAQVTADHGMPAIAASTTAEQLICTACYYLFDPRLLNSAWSSPMDLPVNWRCPDCGATRDSLVPATSHRLGVA